MSKRIIAKAGDLFEVALSGGKKGYFQYLMLDKNMLNSEVVKVFSKTYDCSENPSVSEIVADDVIAHAHVVIKLGIKMKIWSRIGHSSVAEDFVPPFFRASEDYGNPKVLVSKKWRVWEVNGAIKKVRLLDAVQKAYDIAVVHAPIGIPSLIETGKSGYFYPDTES